ncbi:MAG TPA: nucleotide exchange factor GrpE [Candidatus Paceibacterota bacterium]|nr:nucleotide exchange factor GrpE [Candidatus Paceibacterota bacterium]
MSMKKGRADDEDVIDIEAGAGTDRDADTDEEATDLASAMKKIKKLRDELARAQAERQEYLDGWQRLRADVANSKKDDAARAAREKQAAEAALIEEILPAFDAYDMARAAAGWQAVDATWRAGIEQIFSQLENALLARGASRFGAIGEHFDPHLHEAVAEVSPEKKEQEGTIIAVLRSGWKLGDTVLRPAHVTVAHAE